MRVVWASLRARTGGQRKLRRTISEHEAAQSRPKRHCRPRGRTSGAKLGVSLGEREAGDLVSGSDRVIRLPDGLAVNPRGVAGDERVKHFRSVPARVVTMRAMLSRARCWDTPEGDFSTILADSPTASSSPGSRARRIRMRVGSRSRPRTSPANSMNSGLTGGVASKLSPCIRIYCLGCRS